MKLILSSCDFGNPTSARFIIDNLYDNPELNGYYEYFEYGGVMSDEFNNKYDYYFEYPHRISEKMIIIDL